MVMTVAIVAADESSPLTHSTSGIMCAGEKKCIPITLSGLCIAKAQRTHAVIERCKAGKRAISASNLAFRHLVQRHCHMHSIVLTEEHATEQPHARSGAISVKLENVLWSSLYSSSSRGSVPLCSPHILPSVGRHGKVCPQYTY